jgi:hypothetical protein
MLELINTERLISRALGETDANSIVWDYVAVYQLGKLWDQAPPEPVYSSVPVVEVIDGTREAIQKVLQESKK